MSFAATRAEELADAAVAGDRRALARLLAAVENRTPTAEAALRRLYPNTGRAQLVGITGAPGVESLTTTGNSLWVDAYQRFTFRSTTVTYAAMAVRPDGSAPVRSGCTRSIPR